MLRAISPSAIRGLAAPTQQSLRSLTTLTRSPLAPYRPRLQSSPFASSIASQSAIVSAAQQQSQTRGMKVRSSVKRLCDGCKAVKRKGGKYVYIICDKNPKHKQRQG